MKNSSKTPKISIKYEGINKSVLDREISTQVDFNRLIRHCKKYNYHIKKRGTGGHGYEDINLDSSSEELFDSLNKTKTRIIVYKHHTPGPVQNNGEYIDLDRVITTPVATKYVCDVLLTNVELGFYPHKRTTYPCTFDTGNRYITLIRESIVDDLVLTKHDIDATTDQIYLFNEICVNYGRNTLSVPEVVSSSSSIGIPSGSSSTQIDRARAKAEIYKFLNKTYDHVSLTYLYNTLLTISSEDNIDIKILLRSCDISVASGVSGEESKPFLHYVNLPFSIKTPDIDKTFKFTTKAYIQTNTNSSVDVLFSDKCITNLSDHGLAVLKINEFNIIHRRIDRIKKEMLKLDNDHDRLNVLLTVSISAIPQNITLLQEIVQQIQKIRSQLLDKKKDLDSLRTRKYDARRFTDILPHIKTKKGVLKPYHSPRGEHLITNNYNENLNEFEVKQAELNARELELDEIESELIKESSLLEMREYAIKLRENGLSKKEANKVVKSLLKKR